MLVCRLKFLQVLRHLLLHFLLFALWSAVVVVLHTLGHYPERLGSRPGWLYELSVALSWGSVGIPFSAIAALGGALAIFLGFRNNSAYDRWWEARKVWGALVNDSRSFTRQVLAWCEHEDARRELIHRHLAFVHGLALHLRGQFDALHAMLPRFLTADEASAYASVPNVPTALLLRQGRRLTEESIEPIRLLAMDRTLSRLSDVQGACERIKNTPLPRQYDVLPRWFVYFYGLMLPFGLVEPIGWGTLPVSASITLIFLALEVSGRIIEDPFENQPSDTPMTALSITIERDLRAALAEPIPEAMRPDEDGVLM